MAAIAQNFFQASGTQIVFELLKPVAKFCGAGLVLALLFATYGLDQSDINGGRGSVRGHGYHNY